MHKDVKREFFFFKSYIRGRKSYQARKTFRNNVVVHGGGQPMKRIETLRWSRSRAHKSFSKIYAERIFITTPSLNDRIKIICKRKVVKNMMMASPPS